MVTANDWSTIQFDLSSVPQSYPIDEALSDGLIQRRQPTSVTAATALQAIGQQACAPIFEAIRPSMRAHTAELQAAGSRHAQIVRYRNIVSHLDGLQGEYTNLLRNCWLKVAFSNAAFTDSRTEETARLAQARWIREGLQHRAFQPTVFQSIVTARFASENGQDLRAPLVDDTLRLARDFVRVCIQQLLDLVGEMAVGVVQWYPGRNCSYVFFRRQVTSQYEVRGDRIGQTAGVALDAIERHDHHLIDAYFSAPGNSPVPIPQPIAELIDTIPSWLAPQVRLIVGTLVNETITRKVERTNRWSAFPRNLGRGGLYLDPALTIGNFVLTGWSPTDPTPHRAGQRSFAGSDAASDQSVRRAVPSWSRLLGG